MSLSGLAQFSRSKHELHLTVDLKDVSSVESGFSMTSCVVVFRRMRSRSQVFSCVESEVFMSSTPLSPY